MRPNVMNVTEPKINSECSECTVTSGGGKQLKTVLYYSNV